VAIQDDAGIAAVALVRQAILTSEDPAAAYDAMAEVANPFFAQYAQPDGDLGPAVQALLVGLSQFAAASYASFMQLRAGSEVTTGVLLEHLDQFEMGLAVGELEGGAPGDG
jgi:hypothetical protein